MNLYDPSRPHILHLPTYLNKTTIIQPPRILPLSDLTFRVSLFLPVKESRVLEAKDFQRVVDRPYVLVFLLDFYNDPELCVETWFKDEFFNPDVRNSELERELKPELIETQSLEDLT